MSRSVVPSSELPEHSPDRDSLWTGTERLLVWAVVLLVAAAGLLTWKVVVLRSEIALRSPGADPFAVRELLRSEVVDSEGETHSIDAEEWELLLLFVFTPQDCPICHEELLDVGVLAEQIPGLTAYGILGFGSTEEARQTRENFHLPFPVIPDPEGQWISELGLPEMPWKIVVRKERPGILWEDRRSTTPSERQAFMQRLGASLVHSH